ncbi:MAG: EAL domain-containing protein [Gammaproteobacteria bacterium]|nr:EAL domain-containing protein [Gammaproteobacteria bacterium]
MKISYTVFQSRVARRLFILFLVSSLIPILTLGYLSYTSVSKTLLEQSRQHLHHVSKSVGYTIIERLDNLHRELATIALRYKDHIAANKPVEQFDIDRKSRNSFSAIVINSKQKKYVPLYNGIDELPDLSSTQLVHLQNGNPVLIFSNYSSFQKKLLMLVSLDVAASRPSLMIAEINQDLFWDFETIIHNPSFACITTEHYENLYCSTSNIKLANLKSALEANNESSAIFNWNENNTDFIAYYWTIFLEGKFATSPWLVVLSKPKLENQASIDNIKSIYPVVVVLSFLLVILLTASQLRRNLTPLELLQKATKEVASGNFNTQVHVTSNDEFQELANSFNNMAVRLDRQFRSLSVMAEIDRIILSSSNKDYVVDTVLRRIKDIVPCDYVLLSVLDRESITSDLKNTTSKLNETIFKNVIKIEEGDTKLLLAHPKYLIMKSTQHAPSYAKEIVKKGVRTLVLYPIIISGHLHAVISLGFIETHKPYTEDLDHGKEMADRIAVALSNASKEEKIYEQANFDSLTKLPNRTLLSDRLEQAVQRARRDGSQIATLLVDIDRFKAINDSLGHTAGDQLLIEVATRLSSVISETDTLGRLSGDEFVVILSDIGYSKNSTSMITSTAESVLNAIKYPFVIQNHEVGVSASIGISMFPADTTHTEDLLRFAEIAMYHAKSQGKGAYQFYSKDINASSVAQLVLENNLRQAVRHDELELHYQPQIDRATGKIVGAEALLRWHHPELGDLSPADLLPIADTSGLIVSIGDWVLRKACKQIRHWLDEGLPVPRVAINLSAHQFREQNLIKRVRQILKEFDLDVNYLELEITEDTIMTDIDKTAVTLRTLNEMGVRLAVDDFGTGYSSLSYLAKFPIQYLKIDQSFIKDMTRDPNMASIVSAMIALAHSLRLQVVAEGIETQEQYDYLDRLNCDLLQGYLISAPLPPDKFAKLLVENHRENQTSQTS